MNGVSLTPGGIGLALTFHAELEKIVELGDDDAVYVVAEDDARFVDDFQAKFRQALDVLDAYDGEWDFLQIGYFGDDRTFAKPEIADPKVRKVLAVPENVAGTAGIAFKRRGAANLLQHLFPVDWQLDTALRDAYRRTKAYITRHPLMLSEHSTPENSDIQILPPGFKFDPNGAKPPSQKFKVKIGGKQKS